MLKCPHEYPGNCRTKGKGLSANTRARTAPETLRGLKALTQDNGDLKQLEGNLHPFWRLRVDRMRVIYEPRSVAVSGGRAATGLFLR
jgi:mRNA-degrading endonuclease RelE of RelBE toxin-antitoxin system